MQTFFLIVILIMTFPIVSLLHEWGHYYTARMLGLSVEKIKLGAGHPISTWKQGETKVEFNWNCFLGGYTSVTEAPDLNRFKRIAIALGGTVVSVLIYSLAWEVFKRVNLAAFPLLEQWLYIFVILNLFMAVVQLFPFQKDIRRDPNPSDGMQLVQAIFSKRDTATESVQSDQQPKRKTKGRKS
jgi:hypothetical protein